MVAGSCKLEMKEEALVTCRMVCISNSSTIAISTASGSNAGLTQCSRHQLLLLAVIDDPSVSATASPDIW